MVATSFCRASSHGRRMILIGVLLAVMPLPDAMALHAVTQMASNGWRALLWLGHVRWRPSAPTLAGCAIALAPVVAHPAGAEQAARPAVPRPDAVPGAPAA